MEAQTFYQQLGQNIRMFRKLANMTQKQLAQAVQKSLPCISKYEKGDSAIDLFTLHRVAEQLGVSVELLLPKIGAGSLEKQQELPPMFQHSPLYLYWYRSKKQPLVRHVLEVEPGARKVNCYMEVNNYSDPKASCKYMMVGRLHNVGPNIFLQAVNPLLDGDVMLLCFNSVDLLNGYMMGLLCCLNRSYHMTASKCFISTTPLLSSSEILNAIQVTKEELTELKQSNFFTFGAYQHD